MKRFLVLLAMLMTGTAHAGVIVGTAYCTGIQVTDCALAGGVLTDVNGSCVCDTSPPAPPPSDDEREIVPSPTTFPWYTAVKVDIGPTGGGRGSAMLISDCTMLTVGHAVFAPDTGTWLNIAAVHPGHYYNNATNTGIDPFGSKTPLTTATNTKWVDGKGSDYDYGAIFLASSFRSAGITTFIPLAFEDEPDYINSAGYPSEGLPSSVAGATQEQWWAYGWVNDYTSRRMYYDATSTGGASGAGVWVFYGDTSERYLVGINQAHNVTSDGIGTRLVSQNEDVIVGWMARGCPNGGLPALPWPVLRDTLHARDGTPITVRSAAQLKPRTAAGARGAASAQHRAGNRRDALPLAGVSARGARDGGRPRGALRQPPRARRPTTTALPQDARASEQGADDPGGPHSPERVAPLAAPAQSASGHDDRERPRSGQAGRTRECPADD
jgi:V8-like Glu-specific endopeptidase